MLGGQVGARGGLRLQLRHGQLALQGRYQPSLLLLLCAPGTHGHKEGHAQAQGRQSQAIDLLHDGVRSLLGVAAASEVLGPLRGEPPLLSQLAAELQGPRLKLRGEVLVRAGKVKVLRHVLSKPRPDLSSEGPQICLRQSRPPSCSDLERESIARLIIPRQAGCWL